MPRFVVLARDFDFSEMARQAVKDESPKHILGDLCTRLGAELITPSKCRKPGLFWRLAFLAASRAYSNTNVWSIAHEVARTAKTGDLVYATGEDLGLTICVLTMLRFKRPKIAISVIWPERTAPTKLLLGFRGRISLLFAVTEDKARKIRALGGQACPEVVVIPSVVDLTFFSAKPPAVAANPPLVISAGLFDRDYVTLAKAVAGLPVTVDVCAMSSMPSGDASPAYPTELPDNMTIGQQSLKELRNMYRAAALTVVPLVATSKGSGLTVVWEAMASGCPVIATEAAGDLASYVEQGLVIGVPAENPEALRGAIQDALTRPADLSAMADRARSFVEQYFNDERYVNILAGNLAAAEAGRPVQRESNVKQDMVPIV